MFDFVLDSFKGTIFDFKVERQVLVASTVFMKLFFSIFEKYNFNCLFFEIYFFRLTDIEIDRQRDRQPAK